MNSILIITVHGIGGKTWAHIPLISHLSNLGYLSYSFGYPSTVLTLEESANRLDKFIDKMILENIDKLDKEFKIILIGHSAGGRVALLSKHANLGGIITIASPLQGCYLADYISQFSFVGWAVKSFYGPMLQELIKPHEKNILTPLITITASSTLPYLNDFDGRMWKNEMSHSDSILELHLDYSFHSGVQIMEKRMRNLIVYSVEHLIKNIQKLN